MEQLRRHTTARFAQPTRHAIDSRFPPVRDLPGAFRVGLLSADSGRITPSARASLQAVRIRSTVVSS